MLGTSCWNSAWNSWPFWDGELKMWPTNDWESKGHELNHLFFATAFFAVAIDQIFFCLSGRLLTRKNTCSSLKQWQLENGKSLVIQSDLLGLVKWPFQGVVRDLQLGDEKGTLNHLEKTIQKTSVTKRTSREYIHMPCLVELDCYQPLPCYSAVIRHIDRLGDDETSHPGTKWVIQLYPQYTPSIGRLVS